MLAKQLLILVLVLVWLALLARYLRVPEALLRQWSVELPTLVSETLVKALGRFTFESHGLFDAHIGILRHLSPLLIAGHPCNVYAEAGWDLADLVH